MRRRKYFPDTHMIHAIANSWDALTFLRIFLSLSTLQIVIDQNLTHTEFLTLFDLMVLPCIVHQPTVEFKSVCVSQFACLLTVELDCYRAKQLNHHSFLAIS
jgi:hypothetical protein